VAIGNGLPHATDKAEAAAPEATKAAPAAPTSIAGTPTHDYEATCEPAMPPRSSLGSAMAAPSLNHTPDYGMRTGYPADVCNSIPDTELLVIYLANIRTVAERPMGHR
jgi:hypothetical protein